jgi:hypothetical protein
MVALSRDVAKGSFIDGWIIRGLAGLCGGRVDVHPATSSGSGRRIDALRPPCWLPGAAPPGGEIMRRITEIQATLT